MLLSVIINDCWVIEAIGIHNKLGASKIQYYYHPKFGFLHMKYQIFNGIEFILIDVIKTDIMMIQN